MSKNLVLTNALKKKMRHRWENRIYFISCLTTIATYISAATVLYSFFFADSSLGSISFTENIENVAISVSLIFVPLAVLCFRLHESARVLSTGIRVTEKQFPDIYEMNRKYAKIFGIKFIPDIVFSSLAKPISTTIPGIKANTIVLHNMVYEIKRKDSGYRPTLEFALLREYAHIMLGHRTFRRQLLTIVTQSVPFIANFLTRAEEYTADRWAAAILGYDSKDYLCVEATGKFLWENIDINEVAICAGKGGIFEEIYAITMPTPPITWRIHALYKMGVFKHKFNELNFDFGLYDLKNSHGHFWINPNMREVEK